MANNSNQMRAFADVVSIDAWHREFTIDCDRADLHADVVFSTARMGGETESKVRFRLAVKRAELIIIIPETEPVKIDPTTVSRDPSNPVGTKEISTQNEIRASGSAEVSSSFSNSGASIGASAKAAIDASYKENEQTKLLLEFNGFKIQHRKNRDGNYSWIIESDSNKSLQGQPWDAKASPRLTLIDKRKHPTSSLPPAVRLEIKCLREDIEITDIELKENETWINNFSEKQRLKKLKAAEAYIRNKLEEEGLTAVKMEESFSEIIMAHITADTV